MPRRYRLRKIPTAARAGDAFWTQLSEQEAPSPAERTRLLCEGEIVAYELVPWGSNYTFLAALADGKDSPPRDIAIYKPRQGEAPLWDFPDGTLYRREYAAYLLSNWLGWGMVPETIIREGPYGIGTLQQYVESDENVDFFTLRATHRAEMQRMAIFDVITNNADRKAGHCLLAEDEHVWAIDHGLCFHVEPKLRTVLWDLAGRRLEAGDKADLEALAAEASGGGLGERLAALLDAGEVAAVAERALALARVGRLPAPSGGRAYPWPLV